MDHPNRVVPDCSLLSLKCRVPIKDFAAGAIYILIRRESQNELMRTGPESAPTLYLDWFWSPVLSKRSLSFPVADER